MVMRYGKKSSFRFMRFFANILKLVALGEKVGNYKLKFD